MRTRLLVLYDFLAMYKNFAWCFNSYANLITSSLQYRDLNLIVDDQRLVDASRENKHQNLLVLSGIQRCASDSTNSVQKYYIS